MMYEKVQLVCTSTHGRWNKGDRAAFDSTTAKKLVTAKNAAWDEAGVHDEDSGDDQGAENPKPPKGGGKQPAGSAAS